MTIRSFTLWIVNNYSNSLFCKNYKTWERLIQKKMIAMYLHLLALNAPCVIFSFPGKQKGIIIITQQCNSHPSPKKTFQIRKNIIVSKEFWREFSIATDFKQLSWGRFWYSKKVNRDVFCPSFIDVYSIPRWRQNIHGRWNYLNKKVFWRKSRILRVKLLLLP